jgi:hypothetical protein
MTSAMTSSHRSQKINIRMIDDDRRWKVTLQEKIGKPNVKAKIVGRSVVHS